ncbi:TonB-dependent receptor [Usitatibacter palustris]|uniref:Vitamin B12 transporter BtuB n=1 Tax=Usitatibacter palustris TaxID=2732487 RepID=A0A6M4H616_9PROT|nr:TonB-dependent receptor [Usitatibacter palustris]QJR14635.1 Vitamin B12 transporter BtuB [Usitatibacter palustris]
MRLRLLCHAVSLACITGSGSVWAQTTTKVEKLEITGSSIKRIQEEGALPVQVITRQEIEKRGVTSVEQLLMQISANGTGADNLSSNVGIQLGTTDRNNNGNSSANLRGLGASSTLVLMNGRRLSTHGAKGNAVDLSSIPFAAIERVEILKDGASAIYGTDAIGGVINFILRKDYEGVQVSAMADMTEEGGGNVYRGSITAGWGNLDKDRFNILGVLSFDRQEILNGGDRKFSNGYQPERGLSPDTAGTPYATHTGLAGTAIGASFTTPGTGSQTYNRANLLSFQNNCGSIPEQSQYEFGLWNAPGFRYACAYDYGGSAVLIQPVDRTQIVTRGTFKVSNEMNIIGEIIASRTEARKQFEEYQITTTGDFLGMRYPVGGPYYNNLSAYIPSFNANLPIAYRWRCMECGGRTIETTTDAYRALIGIEGQLNVWGSWDYKMGFSQSGSEAESVLGSGYMYTAPLTAALASGQVNPWLLPGQTQTAAALQMLQAASAAGQRLFGGEAELTQFDGNISGEVYQLPAGAISVAAGFDYRKESYKFDDGSRTSQPVYQAPFDPQFPKVERTIKAFYGEIAIPIIKGLEVTGALRYDDYSDFGSTTNPKVSFRWQPIKELVFRGSYNEGFRAPSFFQLYTATTESPIPGNIADPVLCPNGNVPGADLSVCAIRPNGQQGGNPNLKPELSKQYSIGFVASPASWVDFSVDLWQVEREDRIYELTPQQVIANYTSMPENLVRGANGRLDGQGGYIRAGFVNAAGDLTKGTDVGIRFNWQWEGRWTASMDGTYIDRARTRVLESNPYTELVGAWNNRDLWVRWKHFAQVSYERGPWSFTLFQNYTHSYDDQRPSNPPAGWNSEIDKYITYGLTGVYNGFKNLTLSATIKNLLDEDPPFTAHNLDFTPGAGWDPRVADPRGRAYMVRATYTF